MPPTILNLTPSPMIAPGQPGGFPANSVQAQQTTIEFDVPSLQPIVIEFKFATGPDSFATTVVYDGTKWCGGWAQYGAVTVNGTGLHYSIFPDDIVEGVKTGWLTTGFGLVIKYVVGDQMTSSADIMNALNAVGDVTVPFGSLVLVDQPIVIPNNTILRASAGVEFRATGNGYDAFYLRDLDSAKLYLGGAQITRPGYCANAGIAGIRVQSCKHVVIEDADVRQQGIGIHLSDCVSPVPHITPTGTAGSTAYGYVVVCNVDGKRYEIIRPGITLLGNATLSGSNYNLVEWSDLITSFTSTIVYEIYRTMGGSTQGLIATIAAGVSTFNDTGVTATTACPASPKRSPQTNSVIEGTTGAISRTYCVVAVLDGLAYGTPWFSTRPNGNATQSGSNYTIVAWPRFYGRAFASEVYNVYRTATNNPGESTGLIGTINAFSLAANDPTAYEFNDNGLTATTALAAVPISTRNSYIELIRPKTSHDNAISGTSSYGIKCNSVEYCLIDHGDVSGSYLDGGKAANQCFSLEIRGGHYHDNGKSLNNGSSGDGFDVYAGIQHLIATGAEFSNNGGNGLIMKSTGWAQNLHSGVPELGLARSVKVVGCLGNGNAGSGLQVDGVADSTLGGSPSAGGLVRPRVSGLRVDGCNFDNNLTYGVIFNGIDGTIVNTTMRSNADEGLYVGSEASSLDVIGCSIIGNSTAVPAGAPGVTVFGISTLVTLTSDLSIGTTSFTIPSITGIALTGKVSFGRKVAGASPSAFIETYHYSLNPATSTVTLYAEQPGSGAVTAATVFLHASSQGTNARDIVFLNGARHIRLINTKIIGKRMGENDIVSLDGDLDNASIPTTHRNHVELVEGCDEFSMIGCTTRYATSDTYGSPFVPFVPSFDSAFVGRALIDHTDNFVTTASSRYYGSNGSMFRAQPAGVGTGVTFQVKETGAANVKTGWVFK